MRHLMSAAVLAVGLAATTVQAAPITTAAPASAALWDPIGVARGDNRGIDG